MHFQRLNRRLQGHGVLIQPKLHGFELVNALVQLFHIQRGRHPTAQIRQLRDALRRAAGSLFGQILQEIETGHKFAETAHVWGAAHGVFPQLKVEMGVFQ